MAVRISRSGIPIAYITSEEREMADHFDVPKALQEARFSRIAYEIALNHVCPTGRPPFTPYEENAVKTIRALIFKGICESHQPLAPLPERDTKGE